MKDGRQCHLLMLDTEGMGGVEASNQHDSRILSLALLLASSLIYNSLGSVDEAAITNLSCIANLTKMVRLKASKSIGESTQDSSSKSPAGHFTTADGSGVGGDSLSTDFSASTRETDGGSSGGSSGGNDSGGDGGGDSAGDAAAVMEATKGTSFLWVVRDFALDLVDREGNPISADQVS
jgi:hypothetical protein